MRRLAGRGVSVRHYLRPTAICQINDHGDPNFEPAIRVPPHGVSELLHFV